MSRDIRPHDIRYLYESIVFHVRRRMNVWPLGGRWRDETANQTFIHHSVGGATYSTVGHVRCPLVEERLADT